MKIQQEEYKNLNKKPRCKRLYYNFFIRWSKKIRYFIYEMGDVDLINKNWVIKDTKNSEDVTAILSEQVIKILNRRQELNKDNSIWVFPSQTSASEHLMEPKTSWNHLLKSINVEDFHLHDLRRTFGSYQAASGSNSVDLMCSFVGNDIDSIL